MKMNAKAVFKFMVCVGVCLTATPAWSTIILNDVADSDYIVEDSEYPELVDLFYPGDCIGTVISSTHVLTVAHCASDLRSSDTREVNGVDHGLVDVHIHPDYNGWVNDIAVIELDGTVTEVTPYGLYRDTDELGQTMTLVGRGLHATGLGRRARSLAGRGHTHSDCEESECSSSACSTTGQTGGWWLLVGWLALLHRRQA